MKSYTKELSLVDKLYLLALDDNKGCFVSDSSVFGYCVAGALVFQLTISNAIEIYDSKIKINHKKTINNEVLDYSLSMISNSKKERSIKYWIEIIGEKESSIRKKVLQKLVTLKILEEKENKFLWVFTNKNYPTINANPERKVRDKLHDILLKKSKPEVDEIMLISLVDACGLNKEVYGKELAKAKAKEIKKIVKEYPFADTTGKLIKEIHDMIIAVLVIIITTSTITTATVS